jgi:hypothetical protein
MPRRTNKTKNKTMRKKPDGFPGGTGFDRSAQESEYRNLLTRVKARKDAEEVLKIAEHIEREPDAE